MFGVSQVAPILPEFLTSYQQVAIDLHLSDARVELIPDGFDVLLRIGSLAESLLLAR